MADIETKPGWLLARGSIGCGYLDCPAIGVCNRNQHDVLIAAQPKYLKWLLLKQVNEWLKEMETSCFRGDNALRGQEVAVSRYFVGDITKVK